ncbi:MAG TPA: response regulator transcription factor [Herpetosiphonaceae bacterium]
MIRVAVIAAAPAVRAGLRVLLASDPALQVIGDGATLDELRHAPLAAADVVVVHGLLPSEHLLVPEALRGVLFVSDDWESGITPPSTGCAWGVVPGDASAEELIAAVTALYQGLIVIHPHVAAQMLPSPDARSVDADEPLVESLTTREQEVLQLIGQGLANKMIADRLHISEHTVKFHVSAIYAKLGVASRTEAVRSGARRGLIVL